MLKPRIQTGDVLLILTYIRIALEEISTYLCIKVGVDLLVHLNVGIMLSHLR